MHDLIKRIESLEEANEELSNKIDLVTLPLKTAYKVLMWYGLGNGAAPLTPSFNIQEIQGKVITIKAVRIFNYYNADAIDLWLDDGAGTNNTEEIETGYRINRLFDRWGSGTQIQFVINGAPISTFAQAAGVSHYPADLDLDNIFYEFPSKVQTWDVTVFTEILEDLMNKTVSSPLVKVMVECYIK